MMGVVRRQLNASGGRCQLQYAQGFHHARESGREISPSATRRAVEASFRERQKLNRVENTREEQHGASQMKAQRPVQDTDPGRHVLPRPDLFASSLTPAPPWPPWTSFLQHLKGLPFFKESPEAAAFGAADDSTNVKRMVAKFSQAYEHIFDCLSVTNLQVLAEYGCPKDDRRTIVSGNRLRNFLQIEEKRVATNLCDSKPANPRLSDVMRLIYTIAEVARKSPDEVKHSISHLLEEIISTTSNHKHQMIVYSEISKDSGLVLQESLREKSLILEAKTGLEGSSFSCNAKMLSQRDKWMCPRCSSMNWQSKSKCMECSFQLTEKSASDIYSIVQKSSMQSTNITDIKVRVSGKKSKEKALLVSQEAMETLDLDNDRQVAIREALPEQGLTNMSRAAQEQQGLQKCTVLSEDVERKLCWDVSDVDEQSDIFNDIFDSDDTSSLKNEQNFTKCSLSDLVRRNIKAFSSSKRERGAATGANDFEQKGERPLNHKGNKPNDLDVSTRGSSYRAEQTDSFMEVEDRGMLPHRSGGDKPSSGLSMGMTRKQSYSYKAGMRGKGFSGKSFGDDRPRTECRQHLSRERYSDAESEETGVYSSAKVYDNEKPSFKGSKAQGRYADELGRCGSKAE